MFEIVKALPDILIVRATGNCDAEMAKHYIRFVIPEVKTLSPVNFDEAKSFLESVDLAEIPDHQSIILYEEHGENYHYLPAPRKDYHHVRWLVAKRDQGGKWTLKNEMIHAYTEIWKGRIIILRLRQS